MQEAREWYIVNANVGGLGAIGIIVARARSN